jgi:glycosyltransferase involved in cell wall biosynthesis
MEIVVLDDASTDDSKLVIEEYRARYPERIRTIYNEIRSGNIFDQWKKGHEVAKGDLVWICESDDSCEPDFLEKLIPHFSDSSVMFAFGRIQFMDEAGRMRPGLDQYRESAEPGIWNKPTVRPAREWFTGAFGVKNVIANVGGSLWRRFRIPSEIWDAAKSYKIMGDWYIFSTLARGGQIAYEPAAISYFRIHQTNTSVAAQKQASYYQEYARLMAAIRDRWYIPDATINRFLDSCREVFRAASPEGCDFNNLLRPDELLLNRPGQIHVLMGFLGFIYGGGELFPINLANALYRQGVMVSMLQVWDKTDDATVRRMLDPGIPVYTAQMLREMGIRNFIERAGVSVVHSHIASVEMLILDEGDASVPYIATLHGSYEAMGIPWSNIESWANKVSLFAYTADRNLEPFGKLETPVSKFRKLRNAMPVDEQPFPLSRADLGISNNAIVFTFVARGIEGKGWQEAVRAFVEFERREPEREMALLMVGDGLETEKARVVANGNPRIQFLGFQQMIHGLYRISDVALAPTRFSGESYPLCLIQAMQAGIPVIATDVGEIKAMLELNGNRAGITFPHVIDDTLFVGEIVAAMEAILDPESRQHFAKVARTIGETFDIDVISDSYLQLYVTAIEQHVAASR